MQSNSNLQIEKWSNSHFDIVGNIAVENVVGSKNPDNGKCRKQRTGKPINFAAYI